MPEYTEQEKEKKIKGEKISERFEKEFQPEEKLKKNDELGNYFVPVDDITDKLDKDFKPLVDIELSPKSGYSRYPDENQRIKNEKQIEKGKISETKVFASDENPKLSEMIGIILGDGNTYYKKGEKYLLRISSNRIEEKKYRNYTKELMEELFNVSPKSYEKSDRNGTDLTINNKSVVEGLIEKGIIPGNKVKNQVKVPNWIKKVERNKIGCIRGLFDTDGSIYLRNTQKSFGLNFKNGSFPLVKDFKEMCESVGIETQKIPNPKIYQNPDTKEEFKSYQVTIENKFEISKFLNKIKPKKWDFHAKTIGMSLLTFEDPSKRVMIKNELDKKYPDKKLHYSIQYENFLKNLCEKNGYKIDKNNIIKAIEKALSDKRKSTDKLNYSGKELIKELEKKIID